MYVIKRTDEDRYVRCRKVLAFWEDDISEATKFPTKEDAQIEMKRLRIPYCTAVEA